MTTRTTPLRVEASSGRPTDTYVLCFHESFTPTIRGSAQDALDALRSHEKARYARVYRGGRFVAEIARDGRVSDGVDEGAARR